VKTAALIAAIAAVIILLPFGAIMLTGAPPPFLQSGGAPGAAGCGKTATTTTTATTGRGNGALPQNWNAIAQFLMAPAHGYSKNAAAGIDGNIDFESGGSPEQLEIGGGGGGGLIQWTPWQGRAQITGNVASDLAQQLGQILVYNNGVGSAAIATLNAEPTAAAAAADYEAVFERPASLADAPLRSASASAVLTALNKGTPGGGGVTTVTTTTPCPKTPGSGSGGAPPAAATGKAAIAIAFARAQLGKPYVWGGTGPDGFDCSGLVMMAWRAAGVNIQRTSQAQWASLPHETAAQAQPGDLIFYAGSDGTLSAPGHVVMDLGGGQVIQAYSTGTPIEISSLASMGSSGLVGYART
jgi:cell wall-associated NlpC family hydrolase